MIFFATSPSEVPLAGSETGSFVQPAKSRRSAVMDRSILFDIVKNWIMAAREVGPLGRFDGRVLGPVCAGFRSSGTDSRFPVTAFIVQRYENRTILSSKAISLWGLLSIKLSCCLPLSILGLISCVPTGGIPQFARSLRFRIADSIARPFDQRFRRACDKLRISSYKEHFFNRSSPTTPAARAFLIELPR